MDEYLSSIPGYQDDDPLLSTAIYWDTYFGMDKERHLTDKNLREAMLRLAAHEFARHAMSGALLQFAKQGLSIRYGKSLSACPKGRLIGSQSITDVICKAAIKLFTGRRVNFTLQPRLPSSSSPKISDPHTTSTLHAALHTRSSPS